MANINLPRIAAVLVMMGDPSVIGPDASSQEFDFGMFIPLFEQDEKSSELSFDNLMRLFHTFGAPPPGPDDGQKRGTAPEILQELERRCLTAEAPADFCCTICTDSGTVDLIKLPCEHVYHLGCIKPWLKDHNTCPTCRFEFWTTDNVYNERVVRRKQLEHSEKQKISNKRKLLDSIDCHAQLITDPNSTSPCDNTITNNWMVKCVCASQHRFHHECFEKLHILTSTAAAPCIKELEVLKDVDSEEKKLSLTIESTEVLCPICRVQVNKLKCSRS